jgi:hypothetical protein
LLTNSYQGKSISKQKKKNLENTYALIGIRHPIPKDVGDISVGIETSYRLGGPGI